MPTGYGQSPCLTIAYRYNHRDQEYGFEMSEYVVEYLRKYQFTVWRHKSAGSFFACQLRSPIVFAAIIIVSVILFRVSTYAASVFLFQTYIIFCFFTGRNYAQWRIIAVPATPLIVQIPISNIKILSVRILFVTSYLQNQGILP